MLGNCLKEKRIKPQSIAYRAKDPEDFERKAAQPMPGTVKAKYTNPFEQITDKAGVRVITYFLSTVDEVSQIIADEFDVIERVSKISDEPDRFGYRSLHFLVNYSDARTRLAEYRGFKGLVVEIQVRTVLQHAWAEIEHDIQYKSPSVLPKTVSRRFGALAGLIEIADREFQAIEEENRALREDAQRNIDEGRLDQVEITPDSIHIYLDKKYGPDGRMRDWSYEWAAKLLLKLGFGNLAEVDECIRDYNDDQVSRVVYGSRMGQETRFEAVLLASMGDFGIRAHPWARSPSARWLIRQLRKLRDAGVPIGSYQPSGYPEDALGAAEFEALKKAAEDADKALEKGVDSEESAEG